MTEQEFKAHCDDYDGWCTECKGIGRFGMTEPDAEGYECEECGQETCMGMENALIDGLIEITDADENGEEACG